MGYKNLEITQPYLTADHIKIIHLFLKGDDDNDDDDDDDDDDVCLLTGSCTFSCRTVMFL